MRPVRGLGNFSAGAGRLEHVLERLSPSGLGLSLSHADVLMAAVAVQTDLLLVQRQRLATALAADRRHRLLLEEGRLALQPAAWVREHSEQLLTRVQGGTEMVYAEGDLARDLAGSPVHGSPRSAASGYEDEAL